MLACDMLVRIWRSCRNRRRVAAQSAPTLMQLHSRLLSQLAIAAFGQVDKAHAAPQPEQLVWPAVSARCFELPVST